MESLIEACHVRGIRATHQRVEILRELRACRDHPDAETLFERVREHIPTISLDTVYRTLCLLEERGLVSRVTVLCGRARFDGTAAAHAHAVCTHCGCVRDCDGVAVEMLDLVRTVPGFATVESAHVILRGVCARCGGTAPAGALSAASSQ